MRTVLFILGILFALATLFGIGYILIWWGIVTPIMTITTAIDTGAVTASLVGWQVIHFLLRGILACIVGVVGFSITTALVTVSTR